MCGRFEIHSAAEIIARIFQVDPTSFNSTPNYNVAPSQDVLIVINDGRRRMASCTWGFVPSWSREFKSGNAMINARAETLDSSRAFQQAFRNQRCLVVADGFYEWKREGTMKKPFCVRLKSGKPFGIAGLYSMRASPEGEQICTCTIITTDANELLLPVHDRMPAIIPADKYDIWLDPSVHDKETLLAALKPYPAGDLRLYPVTAKVNSYKYNDPENIKPLPFET